MGVKRKRGMASWLMIRTLVWEAGFRFHVQLYCFLDVCPGVSEPHL